MISSVLDSITHIQDLEKDFKQIKSSGKYNELCKILSFMLTFSKISIENFKLIIEHTIDSLLENPLTLSKLPPAQPVSVPRAIQEPSTKKLLRIQTSKDSTPLFESKFSKTTSQEIPNSPKSASSSKTLPQNLTSSSKHSKIKTSDTPRSAVLSISFSSPTNEELNKKLHQVNKNLEKLHHGFSQEKFFPS